MTVEAEISGLIDKFAPPVRELIRSCRDRMARLFPDAVQLVSLAADRHGITLFFQRGTDLPDPAALLLSGAAARPVAGPLVVLTSVSAKQRPRQ